MRAVLPWYVLGGASGLLYSMRCRSLPVLDGLSELRELSRGVVLARCRLAQLFALRRGYFCCVIRGPGMLHLRDWDLHQRGGVIVLELYRGELQQCSRERVVHRMSGRLLLRHDRPRSLQQLRCRFLLTRRIIGVHAV